MKIITTASGKQQIKISKSEWEAIGRKAGWDNDKTLEVMCQACHEMISEDDSLQYDGMKFCKDCYKVKEKESGPNPDEQEN